MKLLYGARSAEPQTEQIIRAAMDEYLPAARCSASRHGGQVEVRPIVEFEAP